MLATWGSSSGFNVASLFSAGEQGAWYDPSDLTTLFQNAAGTTPVTAVEQAVGLILDKSKGLVLGPELVTNTGGPFINTTGWSGNQATLSVVSGKIRVTATATGFASAWIPITVPVGSGSVSINIVANNGTGPGAVTFALYESPPSSSPVGLAVNLITSATNIYIFTTTDGNVAANVYFAPTAIGQYIEISSVSIKSLPGNHAYQSTDASRPTLRARYNLLTYSEQFDNAAWVKIDATISANATTAPDGTTTAELLYPSTTGSSRYINQIPASNAIATIYSFSIYAKAAGKNCGFLYLQNAANNGILYFDLSDATLQVVAGSSTTVTGSITNVGNGWYRIICTTAAGITFNGTSGNGIGVVDAKGSLNVTASGTNGLYIWGAQLLTAADNTTTGNAYQRIAAATDYVTTSTMGGYTFLPYLAFDGSDDSLLTNSVDFSGTDKMTVWSGVTKLSDAAIGTLVELSASWNDVINNGTFAMFAPFSSLPASYRWNSKGTSGSSAPFGASSFAPAPVSNVLTGIGDIAGDATTLRSNGVQIATNTDNQGTGNYGNYPLYIGRRGNSSLPLNGRLYSLIVRGAASNATQISATEAYVASKTGVAL